MAESSTEAEAEASQDESIHVFWDQGMLNHDTGRGVFDSGLDPGFLDVLEPHPENSDRVKNMISILNRGPIAPFVSWHQGRPALISELLSFHTQEYINELVEADRSGGKNFGAGTFLNRGSWDAALLAAGTTLSAMKHILDGHGKISYALVRPPGHHAQPTHADGYCFLNNAGLAAELALSSGINKVGVIDIDVHYGNGTAEGFYRSNRVLTISLHMNHGSWGPSHPQNGTVDEIGEGEGAGYNLNIPLPNGSGNKGYAHAMTELVVPAIEKFEPEMIILVVGQDSSAFDANGRQCLTMEGYRKIGQIIREMAEKYSQGRILIVQEGGYHVTYSAYCLHATLEGVLNFPDPLLSDPLAYYPEDEAFTVAVVESIKKFQRENVPFLKIDAHKEAYGREMSGMFNKNIEKEVQTLCESSKFANHKVFQQVMCHHPKWELKLDSVIAPKHPDDIIEESCGSLKRSRIDTDDSDPTDSTEESRDTSKKSRADEDDSDPIDSTPETSVSCSSTSSRHVGGDKTEGKMNGKATASLSSFIQDEYIAKLRAMRIQREKEIVVMSRKMDIMMLTTLIKKSNLSPKEEELKHRLMDKLYP